MPDCDKKGLKKPIVILHIQKVSTLEFAKEKEWIFLLCLRTYGLGYIHEYFLLALLSEKVMLDLICIFF